MVTSQETERERCLYLCQKVHMLDAIRTAIDAKASVTTPPEVAPATRASAEFAG